MTPRDLDRIRFVTQHFRELQGLRWISGGLFLVSQGILDFVPGWHPSLPIARGIFLLGFALSIGAIVMTFWVPSYYRRFGEVKPRLAVLGPEASALSIYRPAGPPAPLAVERQPMNAMWLLPLSFLGLALIFLLRAVLPATLILTDGSRVDPWAQFHAPIVEVLNQPAWPSSPFNVGMSLLGQGIYALIGTCLLSTWFQRGRRFSQSYHLVLGSLLLGLAALRSCLGLVVMECWPHPPRVFLLLLAHYWMAAMLCGISAILVGLLDHWQLVRVLKPVAEEQS